MTERLKRVPFWYKATSFVTVAALAACAVSKKIGFVTPPPEGTQTDSTEILPTADTGNECYLNIDKIPVTQENFGGSLLGDGIVEVSSANVATETLTNRILAEFQESSFYPNPDQVADHGIYGVDILGSNLIDQYGNKQPFFFVRPFDKDGKPIIFTITDPSGATYPSPFLFYTESDGKQFVPGGTGKEEFCGRFLPVASYEDGDFRYFGLVKFVTGENINLDLFMSYNSKTGTVIYTDPFSGKTTSWQDEPDKPSNGIPSFELTSLISYRSIPEPISTPTVPPEATATLASTEIITATATEVAIVIDQTKFTQDIAQMPEERVSTYLTAASKEITTKWGEQLVAVYSPLFDRIVYVDSTNQIEMIYNDFLEALPQGPIYFFARDGIGVFTSTPAETKFTAFKGPHSEDPRADVVLLDWVRASLANYMWWQKEEPIPEGAWMEGYFTTGSGQDLFDPDIAQGKNQIDFDGSIVHLDGPIFIVPQKGLDYSQCLISSIGSASVFNCHAGADKTSEHDSNVFGNFVSFLSTKISLTPGAYKAFVSELARRFSRSTDQGAYLRFLPRPLLKP